MWVVVIEMALVQLVARGASDNWYVCGSGCDNVAIPHNTQYYNYCYFLAREDQGGLLQKEDVCDSSYWLPENNFYLSYEERLAQYKDNPQEECIEERNQNV